MSGRDVQPPPEWWLNKQAVDGLTEEDALHQWAQLSKGQRFYARHNKVLRPHKKRGSSVKAPPEHWMESMRKAGMSDPDALSKWTTGLTNKQREWARVSPRFIAATAARAQARLDAGADDIRTKNIVLRGTGRRIHATPEIAEQAHLESYRESADRVSREWREFQDIHATGCSVAGCPMAPRNDGAPTLFTLMVHARIDRTEPYQDLHRLRGEARNEQLQKTKCLCIWHNFVGKQSGGSPSSSDEDHKALVEIKKGGCTHPLHSSMAYASLVPSSMQDPSVTGFLDVSHVIPKVVKGQNTFSSLLHDVQAGHAAIHCKFCHKLWTLCESAKMYDASTCQDQFHRLLVQHPAFVHHFDVSTAAIDWSQEKAIHGASKKAGRNKRKRSAGSE